MKILFRRRDVLAAEGMWLEGTWLAENGDDKGARDAFSYARLLDRRFGGAFYNYAALTEKLAGKSRVTVKAWKDYLAMADTDPRQPRETIAKVRKHVEDLEKALK
ncbi:hypothetical protein BH09SUM1_BH09SUM1_06640 [soil metagenome]